MKKLLTIREVASHLDLAEKTVAAMCSSADLPGFEAEGEWFVRRDHFERWIEGTASGRNGRAITREIFAGETCSVLEPVQNHFAARDAQDDEADQVVRPLTERVSLTEIHLRFLDALGSAIRSHSVLNRRPLEAELAPPLPAQIRLYIFNATRPPGGRPLGEHKVQLIVPGQRRGARASFDQSGGRIVFLAGYAAEESVFVLWDAGLYSDFAWSRNVQVKTETLIEASAGKIAQQKRRLRPSDGNTVTETLLATPPTRLGEALLRRLEITRDRMARS